MASYIQYRWLVVCRPAVAARVDNMLFMPLSTDHTQAWAACMLWPEMNQKGARGGGGGGGGGQGGARGRVCGTRGGLGWKNSGGGGAEAF